MPSALMKILPMWSAVKVVSVVMLRGTAVAITGDDTVKDEITRRNLKEVLTRSQKSEILFPKTLEEFERILIDLKE